jgi:ADP-heptose:LPS heptosyltransferase
MMFLVTNDSGPLHISEAVGTPTVCFFGPETPNLFGPTLTNSLIFYQNMYCSPCLNTYNIKKSTCIDNQCLKRITPQHVFSRICDEYFKDGQI